MDQLINVILTIDKVHIALDSDKVVVASHQLCFIWNVWSLLDWIRGRRIHRAHEWISDTGWRIIWWYWITKD